jgi:hypothetical protein
MRQSDKQQPDAVAPRSGLTRARDTIEPAVMQRENEHNRLTIDGRRTDDGSRCSLLVIHEVGGTVALYPHGGAEFGVRLTQANADALARAILAGATQ